MSKNKSDTKRTRIFAPILWCFVVIMWIITLIADFVYGIAVWLIWVHAIVAVICLIVAIVYIVQFRKGRKAAKGE